MTRYLKLLLTAAILILSVDAYMIFGPNVKAYAAPKKLGAIVRLVDATGHTFCTGTVVNDKTIVTAMHCLLVQGLFGQEINPGPIFIREDDNVDLGVTATPVVVQPQMDQGIITGDFKRFEQLPHISDVKRLNSLGYPDAKFTACGYPLGGHLYCTTMYYKYHSNFMWKVSGLLLPGMSGGPVLYDGDTIIGVNVAVEDDKSIISPIYNLADKFVQCN